MPRKRKTAVGARFDACVSAVEAKGSASNPRAVCAATMRRAYGATSGTTSLRGNFADVSRRSSATHLERARERLYTLERRIVAGDATRATRAAYIRAASAYDRLRRKG